VARLIGSGPEPTSHAPVERVSLTETQDGTAVGTPGFMSPEQAAGYVERLDGRSDVWSLGAILYELLTLQPAFEADDIHQLMFQAATQAPPDPCQRSPDRPVDREIADVCLRAMGVVPEDRFPTATDLARAVEAYLEGSKRKEAALAHVAQARAAWQAYLKLAEQRHSLTVRESTLKTLIPPSASLEDKADLLAVREQLAQIGPERARRFAACLSLCDRALSQDPGNAAARALLASVHYARFEEAEAARDEEARLFHEGRVREFDAGCYAPLLRGVGSVSLTTDPAGAAVWCERYEQHGLIWTLVDGRSLGTTPLADVPLEHGSYLLTIRSPGRRATRYPVFLARGRTWSSGDRPIPLFDDATIGAGFTYVPAGPFVRGGDPTALEPQERSEPFVPGFFAATFPVTMGAWSDFLNALAADDPEQAWARVPRESSGLVGGRGQYWNRPEPGRRYKVPTMDRDGDPWDPRWPAASISWHDAVAFAEWRSVRRGQPVRLLAEDEWEKAARGVDGRMHPWGDGFDPALCKMRESRPTKPQPEPIGEFPTDVSPYGVRDLGGGIRDWCGDEQFGDDANRRPARGGAWVSVARGVRCTNRIGLTPNSVHAYMGLRLARDLPGS